MEVAEYVQALEKIHLQLQSLYESVEADKAILVIEDVQQIMEKCIEVERLCQAIRNTATPTIPV